MLFAPGDLTRLGRAIIDMAEDYQAELVVPVMALAELQHELPHWKRVKQSFREVLAVVLERDFIRVEPFGTEQLRLLPDLLAITEMHDRIIVAHAITNDAPLMTSDHAIRDSGLVEAIW
jgi:predicted nucleic acid-binding protein